MTDSSTAIDPAILEELRALSKELGEDVLGEVVGAYRKLVPDLLVQLDLASRSGGLDDLARAAHALKGSSAQIGALEVREAACALEVEARAGRGERAADLAAKCRAAFERVSAEFDRMHGSDA